MERCPPRLENRTMERTCAVSDIGEPFMPLEDVIRLLRDRDVEIEHLKAELAALRETCNKLQETAKGSEREYVDEDMLTAARDTPCWTCGGTGEVHISADDTRVAMDGGCPDCGGER